MPNWLDGRDKRFEPAKSTGVDAIADTRPIDIAPDQASVFQDLEMLGDGRLRQRKCLGDLAADA